MDAPSELAFFVVLAERGSFTAAARALDLTPPAVSKRLAQIEQRLGVRLLNRSTRRASLTAEGELYLEHARRILADIEELEQSLGHRRAAPRGLLRVNATLGFGRTTIAPLVSAFARRHPEVEVQLQLTDAPVDLIATGFDVAVRFGELPDSRLSARRLMSNRRFLCASPAYLAARGAPRSPAELARHACILHRQNDDAYGIWRLTRGRHAETVKVRGALSSNDGDVVLGWALDGHGILIRSEWDLTKYLASGRLKVVLPDYDLPPADLHAVYPAQRNLPARLRAFIDFLVEQFTPPDAGGAHAGAKSGALVDHPAVR